MDSVTTDTSEKGLERLICEALTGKLDVRAAAQLSEGDEVLYPHETAGLAGEVERS